MVALVRGDIQDNAGSRDLDRNAATCDHHYNNIVPRSVPVQPIKRSPRVDVVA